jgi:hypothetical protein
MTDALAIAGERYRSGVVRPRSEHDRRMDIYLQWRWLIGLRVAPPVVTAMGDLTPGNLAMHRSFARRCLEWALRTR